MDAGITEIGIGGVFALLVIKEVFGFVKAKRNGNGSQISNKVITRDEFEKHKISAQYKDNCSEIVKRMDGRFDNIDSQLTEVKTLIRNGN